MARRSLANTEGVQQMPWGIRAYVKVNGQQKQKTFAHGTPLEEIIAWRMETAQGLSEANSAVERGSFAADVQRFLATMTGRRRESFEGELKHWVERLKDRPRRTITREQILAGLAEMQARGLAASTLNHRRQALLSLWKFCDGKKHSCSALDIPKYVEPKPEPRAYDTAILDAALAVMESSKSKARLLMIRWTGARPCEIARLTPERLVVEGENPYVHFTTGKDGDDRVVPLNAGGLDAARMFIEQNAWGAFSNSSLGKSLKSAFVRSRVPQNATEEERQAALAIIDQGRRASGRTKWRLNPYVLRHTCFTELRKNGADLADVQAIAGHKSITTTMRYAPTVNAKLVEAMKRIEKRAS